MCISIDKTLNSDFSNFKIGTSKIPPPKSKTKILLTSSNWLLNPYASPAAVSSLIILTTFNPAISPASLVVFFYLH